MRINGRVLGYFIACMRTSTGSGWTSVRLTIIDDSKEGSRGKGVVKVSVIDALSGVSALVECRRAVGDK